MSQHIDHTHLKIGDKAPYFEAKNQNGQVKTINDFTENKLILYFYPKDNTPTCSVEAQNFKTNYKMLKEQGFEVVGVSPDSETKHQNFIEKYDLPFTLLVDEDHKIASDYGVWGDKQFMGKVVTGVLRTTFVIDNRQHIELVIDDVNSSEASEQILDFYKSTSGH